MKPGSPPPPPPDDEAADSLLTALRERLGDYGQAPPPGAWAAIRRQVAPTALPQPWWRRRAPLVLLGLLLCVVLVGTVGEYAARHRTNLVVGADQPQFAKHIPNSPTSAVPTRQREHLTTSSVADEPAVTRPSPASSHASSAKTPPEATPSLAQASSKKRPITATTLKGVHLTLTATSQATAHLTRSRPRPVVGSTSAADSMSTPDVSLAGGAAPHKTRSLTLASAPASLRRSRPLRRVAAGRHPHATEPTTASYPAEKRAGTRRTGRPADRAHMGAQTVARQASAQHDATETATRRAPGHGSLAGRGSTEYLASEPFLAVRWPRSPRHRAPNDKSTIKLTATDSLAAESTATAAPSATALASSIFASGPVDLLALKQSSLLLPAEAPLAPLVARPDSTPPVPPVRRWSLLVVAGPTLSYRTLGPAPTLAASHPDFARLERPALGLGAQVQVRRVLSGRWALAVGLGYHEYATRLALRLKDSTYTSIHQRDTYRLLTVPVQASYALGVPKSRLSKALLLGFEPGWYLGGRSTEGSGCGCEQQTYSSAANSPYRSLTVAFSLGLDLRYRLGGSASHWQWLVQPTGRYVATPFVRSDAIGFTRRQPFSLGVLTGFSWDMH